jgi:hypothetical protein
MILTFVMGFRFLFKDPHDNDIWWNLICSAVKLIRLHAQKSNDIFDDDFKQGMVMINDDYTEHDILVTYHQFVKRTYTHHSVHYDLIDTRSSKA